MFSGEDLIGGAQEKREKHESIEDGLLPSPEQSAKIQEALKEFIAQEYRDCPHRKIPILGDRTPLEAVLDPDGRELVEFLLLELEYPESRSGSSAGSGRRRQDQEYSWASLSDI